MRRLPSTRISISFDSARRRRFLADAEEPSRGQVRGGHAHRAVQDDDRGGDVLEQRLQAVALVAQLVLLAADGLGHVAERGHQEAEVGIVRDAEADVEVAAGDAARSSDQSLHRAGHRAGDAEGDGYRA